MMTLKGKVALVTGAGGSGVGAATARELAVRGAQVIVNYRSNQQRAQEVVEAIIAEGGKAHAFQADVLDEQQIAQMVAQTIATYGRIDILVNSKGGQPFERTSGGWAHNFIDLTWRSWQPG